MHLYCFSRWLGCAAVLSAIPKAATSPEAFFEKPPTASFPTLVLSAGAYAYQNCSNDDASTGNPLFGDGPVNTNINSVEDCANWCYTASTLSVGDSYMVFGVQAGSTCLCADQVIDQGSSERCDIPCSGNTQEICGGHEAVNVYVLSQYTSDIQMTTANGALITNSAGSHISSEVFISRLPVTPKPVTGTDSINSMAASAESRVGAEPSDMFPGSPATNALFSVAEDLSRTATRPTSPIEAIPGTDDPSMTFFTVASSSNITLIVSGNTPIPAGSSSAQSSTMLPDATSSSLVSADSLKSLTAIEHTSTPILVIPSFTETTAVSLPITTDEPECGQYYMDGDGDLSRIYCNVTLEAPDISTGPADDFKSCIKICAETLDCIAAQFSNGTMANGIGECALKNEPSKITASLAVASTIVDTAAEGSILISGPWPSGGGPGPAVGGMPTAWSTGDSTTDYASMTDSTGMTESVDASEYHTGLKESAGAVSVDIIDGSSIFDTSDPDISADTVDLSDDDSYTSPPDQGDQDTAGNIQAASVTGSSIDSPDGQPSVIKRRMKTRRGKTQVIRNDLTLAENPSTYVAYMMNKPNQPTPDDPATLAVISGGTPSTLRVNGTVWIRPNNSLPTIATTSIIRNTRCSDLFGNITTTWVTEIIALSCGPKAQCASISPAESLIVNSTRHLQARHFA